MDLDFNNLIPELHYYIHRKCTPSWKIDPDITTFIDITYIISGKAEYTIGDQTYTVKKGDLICIPKNTFRTARNIPEDLMECYTTNLFLLDLKGQEIQLPIPVINQIGIDPQLISLFHEIQSQWLQQDFGYLLKVRGILCLILCQILNLLEHRQHFTKEDIRIKDSIQYMSQHYSEVITLHQMAELFHLHPAYYGNLFQKVTGVTFKQYLITLRLNCAENLLKSGEYSISEIAAQSGFSDIFYFSKLFKAKRGISPSAYSRKYQT